MIRSLIAGAVLVGNLLTTIGIKRRGSDLLHYLVSLLDIAIITLAVFLTKSAGGDFFMGYLLALAFAAVWHRGTVAMSLSLVACAAYSSVAFMQFGASILRDPGQIGRLAFLFGMGYFFGLIAQQWKDERGQAEQLEFRMRSFAQHAKHLSRDKYRLRFLSEIGRLGLTGAKEASADVMFEITKRVQQGVGVDRCSLVMIERGSLEGFVAASSDDSSAEVRPIAIDAYPELQRTFADGGITEVHPNEPPELWAQICEYMPDSMPFNSFLVVPIKANEELLGAFYLRDKRRNRSFGEADRDFCWAASLMVASFIHGRDLLDQLRRQSRIDGLTGLLNFQAFTDQLTETLTAPNVAAMSPMTIAVVDMDNLKTINDVHGHIAGNVAITEMGNRLRGALPDAVAMCRYGGDEFVALVQSPIDRTMERLDAMLNGMTMMEWDQPFDLRASIGIGEFPADGETTEVLLESADKAMYLAKTAGGHRARRADECTAEELESVGAPQERPRVPAEPRLPRDVEEQLDELVKRAALGIESPVVWKAIADLINIVESKDPLARPHARVVSELCGDLAHRMGLSEDEMLRIELAGYLHDVGKFAVAPQVLTKEGTFTDEERALVERALMQGAHTIRSVPGLEETAEIISACHERWDGSGYPAALCGEEIPIGAPIVGICDVYNALVSERAQRPAMEVPRAKRLIEQKVGSHWNPEVAHAFLEMLERRVVVAEASSKGPQDAIAAQS